MDIKWCRFFTSDTACAYFLNPCIFGDYVVFCPFMLVGSKGKLGIGVFNKLTGERHPSWNHEPNTMVDGEDISDWRICGIHIKMAILIDRKKLYAYYLATGDLAWKYDYSPNSGVHRFTSVFSMPFQTYGPGSRSWSKLAMFNPETGQKQDLLTLYIEDNYEFSIRPPAAWVSPSNDTILVFLTGGWNYPLSDGRVNAYAYNLTADSILWKAGDIEKNGNATYFAPVVAHNKVVYQCNRSLHCFDIITGSLLWEHIFKDEGFANLPNLYAEGKVFARSPTGRVYAFDLFTGSILWETPPNYGIETGGCMDYYKGRLYFTGFDEIDQNCRSRLFCLDGATGKLLWKDAGVIQAGMMADGVVIDQSTGYLYATDAYRIMCIDLNNSPKKP